MTKIFACAVVLRRCAVVQQVIENTCAADVRWFRAVLRAAVRGGPRKSLKNLVRCFCGGWGVCVPHTPYTLRFPLRGNACVMRDGRPRRSAEIGMIVLVSIPASPGGEIQSQFNPARACTPCKSSPEGVHDATFQPRARVQHAGRLNIGYFWGWSICFALAFGAPGRAHFLKRRRALEILLLSLKVLRMLQNGTGQNLKHLEFPYENRHSTAILWHHIGVC